MAWQDDDGEGGQGRGNPPTTWVQIPKAGRNDGPPVEPAPIQRPPPKPAIWGAGSHLDVAQPPANTGMIRREGSRTRIIGLVAVLAVVVLLATGALIVAHELTKPAVPPPMNNEPTRSPSAPR